MFYGYEKIQEQRFKEVQAELKQNRLAQTLKADQRKNRPQRSYSLLLATLTRFVAF